MTFPANFLWGAATSAYQIEGSPTADGAGLSIWHEFSHTPGLVANGDTGDVACDHYRRWADDVKLMRDLGLTAYRFSIAWGRVLPAGTGRVNPQGLGFYERLVDALLAANIQPVPTLYHWDLPVALDSRGGWLNPDIAGWFAEYAEVMVRALDDRVRMWVTINEPWVVMDGGYLHGKLAPGHRSRYEAPRVTHNLLRAHGAAVSAYRGSGRHQVGIVVNLEPKYPASDRPKDLAATRRASAYMNRQFLDPVFRGEYPKAMAEIFGDAWHHLPIDSLPSIDFLGVNYYTRFLLHFSPTATVMLQPQPGPGPESDVNWEIYPDGMLRILREAWSRYRLPIYVTENGIADHEGGQRGAFIESHLEAVNAAIGEGIPVRGYFYWSLIDNFEWAEGYKPRFGLYRVDYSTEKRTLAPGAEVFRKWAVGVGGK